MNFVSCGSKQLHAIPTIERIKIREQEVNSFGKAGQSNFSQSSTPPRFTSGLDRLKLLNDGEKMRQRRDFDAPKAVVVHDQNTWTVVVEQGDVAQRQEERSTVFELRRLPEIHGTARIKNKVDRPAFVFQKKL